MSRVPALPWWAGGLLGVGGVGLGAVLALRPFTSLATMVVLLALGSLLQGLLHLAGRRGESSATRLVGLVWLLGGVAVLVVPGWTIGALVVVVGLGLMASGVVRILAVGRAEPPDRLPVIMLGLAAVVLGVVALTWPDVTVLVLAAVFGVHLVLLGVDAVQGAWRERPGAPVATAEPRRPRTGRRTVLAAMALLGALALLLVSIRLGGTPRPDAFYDAPTEIPAEAGVLLRSAPFATDIPAGATAWRILYTTTLDDGVPAVASGIVVTPESADAVIAWAHGTTGQARGCAPSLLAEPFVAGAFPDLAAALEQGWAVVATDYAGLGTAGGHRYLVGQAAGRSVLDAVRAAQQLPDAALPTRTVVWGHSQGGHAALWAGGLAGEVAPEVDIAGVAAMAPAANLPGLLADLVTSPIGGVFGSFVIASYAEAYPDVELDQYVRPGARIGVQETAGRCLTDPGMIVSVVGALLGDKPVWSGDPATGALAVRARENVPTLPIAAPLLVAQGAADTLVKPVAQEEWVAARCAAGQKLEYRTYDHLDHMGLVTGESALLPELFEWTAARVAGEAPAVDC